MNKGLFFENWNYFKNSFKNAPFELKLILILSLIIVLSGFYIENFTHKEFYEKIIPVTGWSISSFYFNLFLFSFLVIIIKHPKIVWLKIIIILNLLIEIVLNAYRFYSLDELPITQNPYLQISPFRPIWQVLLPIIWILLVLSPRISKFCKNRKTELQ